MVGSSSLKKQPWLWLVCGLVAGVLLGFGVSRIFANDTDSDVSETVELGTAPVERRDLLEDVAWTGTLSYGEPVALNGAGGTVTSATKTGASINRGDVVAAIDGEPVVAFYGERPLWRTLSSGVEGVDVRQLEANLVALGYDTSQSLQIDDVYTSATTTVVERWQADVGKEVTGIVELSDVVMVPGPSIITSGATVGAAAQGQLVFISAQRGVSDIVSPVAGEVSDVLAVGSPIEHGTQLFLIDETPVVAVVESEIKTDAVLKVITGSNFTVTKLEQALVDGGYGSEDDISIDTNVTDTTVAAVEAWQKSVGLPVSGEYGAHYYESVPFGRIVDKVEVVEDRTLSGGLVLSSSTSQLQVEVIVEVGDSDEFTEGDSATVELANGQIVKAEVSEVGVVEPAVEPNGTPTVNIRFDVLAESDQELIEGAVTVTTIGERVENVLALPTRALLTLSSGGAAVEKVDDAGNTTAVGVELGTFDEGFVEIVSTEQGTLEEGDLLVVPK